MVQTVSLLGMQALEQEFDSAAQLSKRPGSVELHGDMHLKDILKGSIARVEYRIPVTYFYLVLHTCSLRCRNNSLMD